VLGYTYGVCGLGVGSSVHEDFHGVRLTIETGMHQGRLTTLQRVEEVRKRRLKHCVVLRYTYVVFGLDVGPFVQQDRHGVRLTPATGPQQGRLTILQRVEEVRKT
jgi:hypothetical protein